MKTVALVSGGKDSCYNMVLCQQYGHEVVALANLLPEAQETDDLDSYMYQTVGHQVIAAYAECMGLPLYRRRITGRSADQRLVYEDTQGDEVEDLAALLAYIKQQHPEVTAVASGAIASDYQRTRVERVCARLGLVSLAYLWHQPQAALLRRMIDSNIDAILVKIAAAGLTPRKHLGARLASLPAQLHALRRLYGSNVCGEGGEYESLTLDCPLFTRGRIVLDSWQAVTVSEDSMAPVALLHPTAFHVEPKQPAAGSTAAAAGAAAAEVIEVPPDWWPPVAQQAGEPAGSAAPSAAKAALDVQLSTVEGGQYCSLTASVAAAPAGADLDLSSAAGTAAALSSALRRISDALPGLGLRWTSSLFVHLYVPSMAQFGAANAAYAAFLPAINPPSRATVELGGNAELALVVEVLFARQPEGRRVLHVQSISEWAPSCIGPYSQATRHRGLALFAGQIALDPPTMGIIGGGIDAQCVRCLLSCQRVAVAVRTDLPQSLLWCTVYCSDASGAAGRQRAAAHLAAFLEGQLDTALLEQQPQQLQDSSSTEQQAGDGSGSGGDSEEEGEEAASDGEEDLELDEYLQPPAMRPHWQPLLTFVTVPELPRGVLVEIQPAACLVDESLAEDSSSSSDEEEGEEAAAARRSRREAAAAARPAGSSMPGWIGRLRRTSNGSSSSSLWSPGRLCKVHSSISRAAAAADWRWTVRIAASELAAGVEAAGLEAADVAACKIYCLASLLGSQGGPTAAELREAIAAALPGVQPAVVPVTAVGSSAGAEAAILLEALALRS
ncbi:diphthine--ammonia ligase isoform X1 [Chlorella sorokiniana]|uniref:Diphthine--ammonia ligase n=1 Tax=Chlorella sorokiniana TaxID=3076 RepID=A0A2P6TZN1_CHLSO|nr:diphthine--ammonia ligase isoform X1 [Chlorella sorokiniana]|eukprot:PRW59519.1 diphthine--ammonia ligase isoform X1 [Chlorella sorokiniana]